MRCIVADFMESSDGDIEWWAIYAEIASSNYNHVNDIILRPLGKKLPRPEAYYLKEQYDQKAVVRELWKRMPEKWVEDEDVFKVEVSP